MFFISNGLIGLQTIGLDTGMLTPRYVMLRSRPVERIHMTSRRPYWCSKTIDRWPTVAMLVYQEDPVGVELFSYLNAFFCSSKFA